MSIAKKCFVIMPFSDSKSHSQLYWDKHYELFLKPIVEKNGLNVSRSKPFREAFPTK